MFVKQLTYAYSRKVHRSTRMTLIIISLMLEQPGAVLQDLPNDLPHEGSQQVPANLLRLTSYMDYRSCERKRARRSRRCRHDTKRILTSPCGTFQFITQTTVFMLIDRLQAKRHPSEWSKSHNQSCCRNPMKLFDLSTRRHTR